MTAKVKFVVDSITDLPAEWLARWDIPVFGCYVNFGEESFVDIELPKPEFYRRLAAASSLPRTSAGAPGVAKALIAKQLENAEHVVAFAVASQLSSIYNTIRLAAEEFGPDRVTVIDSGQASMGEGWQVVAAAEAAERGADLKEILEVIRNTRERVKLYAAIDTLEYLKRGGRVNAMFAGLGTLLQIKPIIEVKDGVVTSAQRVRTMSKAELALIDFARAQAPLEYLAVLHSNFPSGAALLKDRLADIAPPNTILVDITTALGTHVGPGALGIASVKRAK
jgi:DegV family protein with EDD domain